MKNLFLGVTLFSSLTTVAQGQGCAPKMSLLEMACARDCGPCTFHLADIKQLYVAHQDNIAMVYYAQAPIGIGSWGQNDLPYSAFYNIFNMDYQSSVMVDRTFMSNNYDNQEGTDTEVVEDAEIAYDAQMANTYVPVSIELNHTYNAATRQVSVDITGAFCEAASGDMRFYLVVVQDSVIGEGVDYAQAAFNESSANDLGYFDIISDGVYLWINHYAHIQVVKYQPSGFFGNAGVIGANVTAGQSFTENYTFTLPEFGSPDCVVPVTPEHVEIIAAVVYSGPFDQRKVLNANKVKLVESGVGINEVSTSSVDFEIVGNPVSGSEVTLQWGSQQELTGDVILFNALGEVVSVLETNLAIGGTLLEKTYPIGDLTNGVYFVGYKTADNKQYTRKLLISK